MTKEFEKRVIREGVVDTKKYRYVYESETEGVYIIRLERKYLGTTVAIDGWEMVKDFMLPEGKSFPRECRGRDRHGF